jgi:hypothetical protein
LKKNGIGCHFHITAQLEASLCVTRGIIVRRARQILPLFDTRIAERIQFINGISENLKYHHENCIKVHWQRLRTLAAPTLVFRCMRGRKEPRKPFQPCFETMPWTV